MVDRKLGSGSAWARVAGEVQVTRVQLPGVHGGLRATGQGLARKRDAGTLGPECAAGAAGAGAAGPGDSGEAATHRSWCCSRAGACAALPPLPPLPPPGLQTGRETARRPARPAPEVERRRRGPAHRPGR